MVRDWELSGKSGRARKDKYHKCGRKAVLTLALVAWLVKKLLLLRMKMDCTSGELCRILAKEQHVKVTESCVRKAFDKKGYYYLPRNLKPKLTKGSERNAWTSPSLSRHAQRFSHRLDPPAVVLIKKL